MPILLIILISFPAISALFKPGFFYAQDSAFHLVRLVHFYNELVKGQFPVRWAQDLVYGLGYPIFNYNYPLLYYFGSLVHLYGFDYGTSIKIVMGLAMIGSGFAMYWFLRSHFNVIPAFMGAVFYLYTPYRFLAIYVNGAFGIILSLFFLPLVLYSIAKISKQGVQYAPWLAVCITGLFLSHNVSSLIFLPLIIIYASISVFEHKLYAKYILLGFVLGFGLSSFFLIPAFFERNLVKLGTYIPVKYTEHFPTFKQLLYSPWGYGFSGSEINDLLSFQIGLAQWMVVIFAFGMLKQVQHDKIVYFFLLTFLLSLFLMLPISIPVWKTIPFMPNIQFPWRFLMLSMVCTSFLTAFILSKTKSLLLTIFLFALVMFANRNHLRTMVSTRYPDEYYFTDKRLFFGPTDIAYENSPIWADYPEIRKIQKYPVKDTGLADIVNIETHMNSYALDINSTASSDIVLNRYYFPMWKGTMDGKELDFYPNNKGLLTFKVEPGKHEIKINLVSTHIQKISNIISVISFLVLITLIGYNRKRRNVIPSEMSTESRNLQ